MKMFRRNIFRYFVGIYLNKYELALKSDVNLLIIRYI